MPSHALTHDERAQLLAVANQPRFASVPPARIAPMLADEGVYLASESSFCRVLREHGQSTHRGRAKAVSVRRWHVDTRSTGWSQASAGNQRCGNNSPI
jgi:putative transposase